MANRPNVNDVFKQTLRDNNIGYEDYTSGIHGLNYEYPLYNRPGNAIGIVMHNTSGMILLANLVGTWKSKEPHPPPSHLAIDQTGRVGLYVKLEYADRATENTNKHISIEFQAVENGDITDQQVATGAVIAAFMNVVYGMRLEVAESRTASGLAHHSMFVDKSNPDGHANCPGLLIIAKKKAILEKATAVASKMSFSNEPAGRWRVKVAHWVWNYTFSLDGKVVWLDPFNNETGEGTWAIDAKLNVIVFTWKNSKSTETWNLPLVATAQKGKTTIEGVNYDLDASRT